MNWLFAGDLAGFDRASVADAVLTLIVDLRDPRALPLLRPAPTPSDHADERRPGASDRACFLARRAATRSLAGLFIGCSGEDVFIGYDAPGAPRVISHEGVWISVSGRGPFAAIAVADRPVGVDLEILHEGVEVISDVLHAEEKAAVAGLAGEALRRRFLRIWTAKEACLKALGAGLNIDPATLSTVFAADETSEIVHTDSGVRAQAQMMETLLDGTAIVAACVTLPRD